MGKLGEITHGPEVMVLETEKQKSNGYEKTEEDQWMNNMYSFIFSSTENVYGMPEYAKRYSLDDIQCAYWELLYLYANRERPVDERISENGAKLAETAANYQKFIDKVKTSGYNSSIDSDQAQVIVNRTTQQYILGPYKLNYDDYEDVNYVKDLIIQYGNEQELVYGINGEGKEDKDFEIVLEGNVGTSSNGMKNQYPKNNQNFFLVVDANKIGVDTKTIELIAKFEHVSTTYAHYLTYEAEGDVYRYNGHYLISAGEECAICGGSHTMVKAKMNVKVTYEVCDHSKHHKDPIYGPVHHDEEGYTDEQGDYHVTREEGYSIEVIDYDEYDTYHNRTETYLDQDIDIYIPYIQMHDHIWKTDEAQTLTVITGDSLDENAYRVYEITDVQTPKRIDLTMSLGGYVWVDADGGKESKSNGWFEAGEDKVSNLVVRLFKENDVTFADKGNAQYLETKTNENGEYRFNNLSPMFKYYVRFYYNGQYYEPTEYTSPYDTTNGWGKGNWEINSNAVDKEKEREKYNEKFATIGSNPANYDESKQTYTKMELLGYTLNDKGDYVKTQNPTIDEFGNLIDNDSPMAQYVKDSLITAYTMNPETEIYDYYPTPNIFVEDTKLNNRNVSRNIYNLIDKKSKGIEAALAKPEIESILYPTAYYINLGLHPRQETDIAVKKDVEKVTLEINNKVHEYTYDTLDTFKCSNNHIHKFTEAKYVMDFETYRWKYACPDCGESIEANWDISVRLSDTYHNEDGYYDTRYDRGIYKSDYDYKVSMYGTPDDFGKTKADELEVYVTYKIMVSNQSLSIRTRIDELVDYYDSTYELVPERSYIEINKNGESKKHSIVLSEDSKCGPTNNIGDYSRIFIRGIGKDDSDDYYLEGGESAYFYVTFRVIKKTDKETGENWLQLGTKENIAELNGYSTKYADGTTVPNRGDVGGKPAGIVDMNSTPGNQRNTEIRENDTDKAPSINIHLYKDDESNRVIEGSIWEDERTKELKATTIGNGTLDNGETLINGVTVQLVELMENGTEFVWREFGSTSTAPGNIQQRDENGMKIGGSGNPNSANNEETPIINISDISSKFIKDNNLVNDIDPVVQNYKFEGSTDGKYAFKSFMPGNYIVRFIYGDTVKTVLPNDGTDTGTLIVNGLEKGQNAKSYNGQDYKSTTYQTGVEQNKTYTWEQAPYRLVVDNGQYRLYAGDSDPIQDWKYYYVTYNGTNLVFEPVWDNIGQRKVAPKLTEISTFKANALNNETVKLPSLAEITDESFNTPVISVDAQNGYLYDIKASDSTEFVSDAKDIESRRNIVNDYSDNDVVNHEAEVLASHKVDYTITAGEKTRKDLLNELIDNTQMTAETGLMVIEFEYDDKDTDTDVRRNPEEAQGQGKYTIQNVNLGLEERPKAQLEIEKEITNVKLTLADSSVLFDAKQSASNVLWNGHKDYETGYVGNFMDPSKFGNIENIRKSNITKFGLVQLTMDEELMHGATIKIDYKITVKNVGEVDYYETYTLDTLNADGTTKQEEKNIQNRLFYYKGEVTDKAQVVTTRADEVMDYVENNLQFNVADNNVENSNKWEVKSNDLIKQEKLVNTIYIEDQIIDKYNTKIFTESLNAELVPTIYKGNVDGKRQDSTNIPLVLTQLITSENSTDDLTYRNIVELVRTSNTVGRRMEYSVVGNQNPFEYPAEIDTDLSEKVKILPPFGEEIPMYMIISIIVIAGAGMLVPSIIFIKQKVLGK